MFYGVEIKISYVVDEAFPAKVQGGVAQDAVTGARFECD